ncbi:uncharacterized protein SCODWIG_03911 [Saccharomycodes ludwigii]|uniref:GATA-type domain-containing protein n=1 Tax=Saccharomycodes ludwigii TaxID=36035 RepID=A0A376BC25_9ASCO|nr:uncharacterized protein SCODWIG_03911 [Saccharomycodes ludwigii]
MLHDHNKKIKKKDQEDNEPTNDNKQTTNNINLSLFDSMLEILPDELDYLTTNTATTTTTNDNYNKSHPIDISDNQQNGEIAQLWDFNVDEFMMTPSNSSGSATISAPNSYSSERNGGTNISLNDLNNTTTINNILLSSSNTSSNGTILLSNSVGNSLIENNTANTIPTSNNNNGLSNISKHFITPSSSSFRNTIIGSGVVGTPPYTNMSLLSHSSTVNNTNTKNNIRKNINTATKKSINNNNLPSNVAKPHVQCFNCKTFKTPLWRRDPQGNTLCNACGLFQKLHGTMRPLSMKTDVIKKRNTKKRGSNRKVEKTNVGITSNNNNSSSSTNLLMDNTTGDNNDSNSNIYYLSHFDVNNTNNNDNVRKNNNNDINNINNGDINNNKDRKSVV